MITKIQLHKNATVLAMDGTPIGSLERVVVNPGNKVLTDIVVRTGNLINHDEKVVPIELVSETADDQILLDERAGGLERFPSFEEEQLVGEHGETNNSSDPMVEAPLMPGYLAISAPIPAHKKQIITRIEHNIPHGTVAMKEGAIVVTADGKNVGKVEGVFAEPIADQITHLLIAQGSLLVREYKLIPADWMTTLGEESIRLGVNKSMVDKLAEAPLAG